MQIESVLGSAAVIGAGGKMGSGIALLAAELMAGLELDGHRTGGLTLIDSRPQSIEPLRAYLEKHLLRRARRRLRDEREARSFSDRAMALVSTAAGLEAARDCTLLFEAVPESEDLKAGLLRRLRKTCPPEALFLSNTSSIPIRRLDEAAGLDGRVVGFHFYNPPAVQKLLELIPGEGTRPGLVRLAEELTRRFGKTVVRSRDVAGFIGNGHFIREGLYAAACAARLRDEFGEPEAIYAVNAITEVGLLRPMGIFQVIDYAGIDVFAAILGVMERCIEGESFPSELFARMVAEGRPGGQHGDGSQKDGFFQYDGRRRAGVYDCAAGEYRPLDDGRLPRVDDALGALAEPGMDWSEVRAAGDPKALIRAHFQRLAETDGRGAAMALEYASESRRIAARLVGDGVAASAEDVDTVVTNGFHHLYGPLDESLSFLDDRDRL